MNDEDIEEQLSLIGALAEDAEAGFESMLVPFSVYGIAIPVGTGATYCCISFGSAKYVWLIWLFVIGFCQLFLPLYFRCFTCRPRPRRSHHHAKKEVIR